MTPTTDIGSRVLSLRCEEKTYPPYDAFHGTPHAMLWRRVVVATPRGTATLEQTDYGHPGRLNPWSFRGVDSGLQGKLTELVALAEAAGKV